MLCVEIGNGQPSSRQRSCMVRQWSGKRTRIEQAPTVGVEADCPGAAQSRAAGRLPAETSALLERRREQLTHTVITRKGRHRCVSVRRAKRATPWSRREASQAAGRPPDLRQRPRGRNRRRASTTRSRRGGTAIHSGALDRSLSTGTGASTWPRRSLGASSTHGHAPERISHRRVGARGTAAGRSQPAAAGRSGRRLPVHRQPCRGRCAESEHRDAAPAAWRGGHRPGSGRLRGASGRAHADMGRHPGRCRATLPGPSRHRARPPPR